MPWLCNLRKLSLFCPSLHSTIYCSLKYMEWIWFKSMLLVIIRPIRRSSHSSYFQPALKWGVDPYCACIFHSEYLCQTNRACVHISAYQINCQVITLPDFVTQNQFDNWRVILCLKHADHDIFLHIHCNDPQAFLINNKRNTSQCQVQVMHCL